MTAPRDVRLLDCGRAPYGAVWDLQKQLHGAVANGTQAQTWIVVEHDPVITLGRNARQSNVLSAPQSLAAKGVEVYEVERGGDVTYHGPGQVVVYPIVKLERFREVVPLVGKIERAVIDALVEFGIPASGRSEHRGVYVGSKAICAVGLAVKQMTTLHGLALNVTTVLDYDRLITPCGTPEFGITSVAHETGGRVTWDEGRAALLRALERAFDLRFVRENATPRLASAS